MNWDTRDWGNWICGAFLLFALLFNAYLLWYSWSWFSGRIEFDDYSNPLAPWYRWLMRVILDIVITASAFAAVHLHFRNQQAI